jgi:exopolysaccharide biosynthesis protein
MEHQFLATWFLSDEEINEILEKLKVNNDENSNSDEIIVEDNTQKEITVDKITGKNYVGFVMTIPDPSKVKLVDARLSYRGTKLSEIVEKYNAVAGINASGFTDKDGLGSGNSLCKAAIVNKEMQYGNKSYRYDLIGLTSDSKLVLGKYNYQEAMDKNIVSAVEFGPYIIVNGKNQITNANSGGIHPRTAIGQKQDGTMIFVVIDGRQVGYSIGTNFLELQNIFNKYDAYNAANLDGGSSSTMYYNGKLVNKPSTPAGQRYLPNAFIVTQ